MHKNNQPQAITVRVRPAAKADLKQILANERAAFPIPWSENVLAGCLDGDYLCWVLSENARVIGHMIILPVLDELHLLNICIHPAHQARGLGQYWLDFLFSYARQNQYRMVLLEVRVSNQKAIGLYRKMGFGEIGLRKGYYKTNAQKEDALVMKAMLDLIPPLSESVS